MQEQEDAAQVYNISKDYRIVAVKGNKCSLFFKNKQNQLVASLEGCQNIFTAIVVADNIRGLTDIEKKYLLSFIRVKKYSISKEVAAALDISVIKYTDGREDYLSEKQIKRRIASGIDFARIYIGKLSAYVLKIPADSKDCLYHFGRAEISRLVIGENCSINLDLRDNAFIESLVVGERFSGAVNLSRTSVESVFIGNNCRCNLTITDAKKCFNLQIADIYSGNLNISHSCLYAFSLGYYSYADLVLSNNIVKKDIAIGDSFRGGIYATNQHAEAMHIGDDCKGWIKLNNQSKDSGLKKLVVGSDFAGNINLSGDESIEVLETGRKNSGKIDASYATALDKTKVGKFYSGQIDFSGSNIRHIQLEYGASGSIKLKDCQRLTLVQATLDNKLIMEGRKPAGEEQNFGGNIYYNFDYLFQTLEYEPIYKRLYHQTRKAIHDRFM